MSMLKSYIQTLCLILSAGLLAGIGDAILAGETFADEIAVAAASALYFAI